MNAKDEIRTAYNLFTPTNLSREELEAKLEAMSDESAQAAYADIERRLKNAVYQIAICRR